jgi:hypothetical protein
MVTELHRCPMCEGLFEGKANARFCSARCRKRASRQKVTAKGNLNQTHYQIVHKHLYTLAGLDAQNSLKALALLTLTLLNDANKKKVWDMLRDYPFDK